MKHTRRLRLLLRLPLNHIYLISSRVRIILRAAVRRADHLASGCVSDLAETGYAQRSVDAQALFGECCRLVSAAAIFWFPTYAANLVSSTGVLADQSGPVARGSYGALARI